MWGETVSGNAALSLDREPVAPMRALAARDARVRVIATEMAAGKWSPERVPEYAAEWNADESTIRHYSAEASRMLDWTAGDREKLVQLFHVRLAQIALSSDEETRDQIAAIRLEVELLGLLRQGPAAQVTVNVGKLGPSELRSELRASLQDPDDTFLEVLSEPGVIEGLNALVYQRRKMLVETTGESTEE